jgi:uncharacterized RDD family membrane protein YckC
MAIITVQTPFNIELEFKLAGIFQRLLAWTIDIFIICAYYYIMLRFLNPLKGGTTGKALEYLLLILPVFLYQVTLELFLNGQTIGKKIAGIKVIDNEGKEPSWGQYIIRWLLCLGNMFVYFIPYMLIATAELGVTGLIGIMTIFFVIYLPDFLTAVISKKSQRIGDFAAGTVVIDKHYKSNINETIYLDIEEKEYKPMYPEVMKLNDRDINGIRNLLNTKRPSRETERYMETVALKIQTVLSITSDTDPKLFLQKLLEDYNYYTSKS